jgi:hypothetical protein
MTLVIVFLNYNVDNKKSDENPYSSLVIKLVKIFMKKIF